jgi:hypothetical protein
MKNNCGNCAHYVISHDRHGFDDGLYEDNSFCGLRESGEGFYENLDESHEADDKAGTLGWITPCPNWAIGGD